HLCLHFVLRVPGINQSVLLILRGKRWWTQFHRRITALEVPNHQQQVTLLDKTLQTVNHQIPNMNDSVGQDGVSRASIKGLEDKLTQLMKGEGSGIMIELRQAGQ
ncbi:hypothetical protein MAR_015505, partial [Mya arenaria]